MRFFLKTQPMVKNTLLKCLLLLSFNAAFLTDTIAQYPIGAYTEGEIGHVGTALIDLSNDQTFIFKLTNDNMSEPPMDCRPTSECGNITKIIVGVINGIAPNNEFIMGTDFHEFDVNDPMVRLGGDPNSYSYKIDFSTLLLSQRFAQGELVAYVQFITPKLRTNTIGWTQVHMNITGDNTGNTVYEGSKAVKVNVSPNLQPLEGRIVDIVEVARQSNVANDGCKAGKIRAVPAPCTQFNHYRWTIWSADGSLYSTVTGPSDFISLPPDRYTVRVEGSTNRGASYSTIFQRDITIGFQTTVTNIRNVLSTVQPSNCCFILGVYLSTGWEDCIQDITCRDLNTGNNLPHTQVFDLQGNSRPVINRFIFCDIRRDRTVRNYPFRVTVTLVTGQQIVFDNQSVPMSYPCSLGKEAGTIEHQSNVFPNPTNTAFNLTTAIKAGQLELVNAIGQSVLKQPLIDFNTILNVQSLNEGIYFLRIFDAENQLISNQKVVIQR